MAAWVACHQRNLAHTESKAVTPIDPAAQKFHLLILCSLSDNSVTLAASSVPGLVLRKCHIADANQHVAEIHPVISAAVSMSDLIIRSHHSGKMAIMCQSKLSHCLARFRPGLTPTHDDFLHAAGPAKRAGAATQWWRSGESLEAWRG